MQLLLPPNLGQNAYSGLVVTIAFLVFLFLIFQNTSARISADDALRAQIQSNASQIRLLQLQINDLRK